MVKSFAVMTLVNCVVKVAIARLFSALQPGLFVEKALAAPKPSGLEEKGIYETKVGSGMNPTYVVAKICI